jgi:hypothetical protein
MTRALEELLAHAQKSILSKDRVSPMESRADYPFSSQGARPHRHNVLISVRTALTPSWPQGTESFKIPSPLYVFGRPAELTYRFDTGTKTAEKISVGGSPADANVAASSTHVCVTEPMSCGSCGTCSPPVRRRVRWDVTLHTSPRINCQPGDGRSPMRRLT